MGTYTKTWVSAAGAVLVAAQAVTVGGDWPTFQEWITIGIAAVTAVGVWGASNTPPHPAAPSRAGGRHQVNTE